MKGNIVQASESHGYKIEISGPSGRERYVLKDMRNKGRVISRGELPSIHAVLAKALAESRLRRFERDSSALARAEARLRKFRFDTSLDA